MGANQIIQNIPRSELDIIKEAVNHNTIGNALSNISDEVMPIEEINKQTKKAVEIMEEALYKILEECTLYGDEAIIEVDDVPFPAKYSCYSFMESILSEALNKIDTKINSF